MNRRRVRTDVPSIHGRPSEDSDADRFGRVVRSSLPTFRTVPEDTDGRRGEDA